MRIVLTEFAAKRHFDPSFKGTKICDMAPEDFEKRLNVYAERSPEAPGYAPFCKHLFVHNFTQAKHGVVRITLDNEHLLRTAYAARRPGELPVLKRFFRSEDVVPERAPWLDVVLYSKEQCAKEGTDIGDAEWGIVAILSALGPKESPMQPITMMRNALGIEQGGSGHPLDMEAYAESVAHWSEWATVQ